MRMIVAQVLYDPAVAATFQPQSDYTTYSLTTCSSPTNGTTMIRTQAPYTLQNGTVIPAGSLPSSALFYQLWAVTHIARNSTGQFSTFVFFLDLGWYDRAAGNYTYIPDP